MGSDSDLWVMKEAAEILNSFGVTNEVKIVSAHRTVKKMIYYAKTAKTRGIQVIIAGAGGAAHLPGMVAGYHSAASNWCSNNGYVVTSARVRFAFVYSANAAGRASRYLGSQRRKKCRYFRLSNTRTKEPSNCSQG